MSPVDNYCQKASWLLAPRLLLLCVFAKEIVLQRLFVGVTWTKTIHLMLQQLATILLRVFAYYYVQLATIIAKSAAIITCVIYNALRHGQRLYVQCCDNKKSLLQCHRLAYGYNNELHLMM